MTSDVLLAQYPKQQCVRDRNYASLLRWAAYTSALPIPADKPDEAWVRRRCLADSMPDQIESVVQRTLSYFQMDPATTEQIHDFLNPFGDPDVEDQLSQRNSAIIGAFVDRFAKVAISDDTVAAWYTEHGFV